MENQSSKSQDKSLRLLFQKPKFEPNFLIESESDYRENNSDHKIRHEIIPTDTSDTNSLQKLIPETYKKPNN